MQHVVGQSATTWYVSGRGLSFGDEWRGVSDYFSLSLSSPALAAEDVWWGHLHIEAGFELLHMSYQLGISQRRSEWFCRWCQETAKAETTNTFSVEEWLG